MKPSPEDLRKMWMEDLSVYRKIESWATALFLGGITLTTKTMFEWQNGFPTGSDAKIKIPDLALWAPAVAGLFGSLLMAIVNRRNRRTRTSLFGVGVGKPRGSLGVLFAIMPLTIGTAGTALLQDKGWLFVVGPVVAFLIVAHIIEMARPTTARDDDVALQTPTSSARLPQ